MRQLNSVCRIETRYFFRHLSLHILSLLYFPTQYVSLRCPLPCFTPTTLLHPTLWHKGGLCRQRGGGGAGAPCRWCPSLPNIEDSARTSRLAFLLILLLLPAQSLSFLPPPPLIPSLFPPFFPSEGNFEGNFFETDPKPINLRNTENQSYSSSFLSILKKEGNF
jgi:hypothetical protein